MGETRKNFDRDFREDAMRLVRETGRPIAQVARDLGINEGTLGNWVNADRRRRDGGEGQRLLELTTLAGRTMVEAAATDRWETAERRYAKLLGQGNAEQTQLAERWLEDTREQLAGRPGADMELIRTALAARWARRWADLLEENPNTEVELRALVQEIQTGLPAGEPSTSSHAVSANDAVSGYAAGPEHPGFLAAQSELAYSAGQAGDAAAARDQFAALLPVAERVLGPEHPDILINRHNLANFTGYTGDAAAARDQFAALLRVRERLSGADSPDTLVARFNLACWTGCAGDAAAARDQFAALLLSYEQVLGPEHAETLAVWHQLAHWTALARNDAAKQGMVTRSIGHQGVADADDEGVLVEDGEGDSESLGEFDGLGERDFDVSGDGGGWNGDDT